jgi:diaminopimelate decarboxylase
MAQWVAAEGLSLAVSSAGELAVAQAVSFPAERIILLGNATPADLRGALRYGVDRMVVDSTAEILRLAALTPRLQRVFVQVTPDVHASADRTVVTGADDQRSGFSLRSGAAADAVRRVLSHPELTLIGLRCQLASLPTELSDYETAAREILGLMAAVRDHTGVTLTELNLGGGHAVPYLAGDDDIGLASFADRVRRVITSQCAQLRLPVPHLVIEPGRAIVNRAMITLCRVLAVKRSAAGRMFVTLDGSLTEIPGQELYGAGYSVHAVRPSNAPSEPAVVAGRHGEAGDVLAADVALPADVRPGDLIALPGTGAYNHSMAPGYTLVGRPPVIAVKNGEPRALIRKETISDLLVRDIGL